MALALWSIFHTILMSPVNVSESGYDDDDDDDDSVIMTMVRIMTDSVELN